MSAVLDLVDAWMTPFWPVIHSTQVYYRTTHGHEHYFQGLSTHAELPADGTFQPPDNVDDKPTDQAEYWQGLPASMPCAVTIDVYDGPNGEGYVVTTGVRITGTEWSRSDQVGPETWRDLAWAAVVLPS